MSCLGVINSDPSLGCLTCRNISVCSIFLLGRFVPALLRGVSAIPWVVDRITSMIELGLLVVPDAGFIILSIGNNLID